MFWKIWTAAFVAAAIAMILTLFIVTPAKPASFKCLPYIEMVELLISEYQEDLAYARPFPDRNAVALIFVSARGTWTEVRVNSLTWMACVSQVGRNWPVAPSILYWAGERT